MMEEKKDSFVCPENKKKFNWLKWIFPIGGFLSLLWFLVRVIPKPSRATYPCQRVAFPLASSFVIWICGVVVSAFAWRKARELLLRSVVCKATICLVLFAIASFVAIVNMPESVAKAVIDNTPNVPIGEAKGVNPGRVVWVYDPNATSWTYDPGGDEYWDGMDSGGTGYWFEPNNTDQNVVDEMMADAIMTLADETNEVNAWDALFRNFNLAKHSLDEGYQAGQKIMIKINLVSVGSNYNSSGDQTAQLGWVMTSPQMILALLRQLVYVVGVAEDDISVGDTLQYFPNHYWNLCHGEFPDVHYIVDVHDTVGLGREPAVSSQGDVNESPFYWSTPDANGYNQDYAPLCYAEADYLINFACLKTHGAGVTLCAKNHYGSLGRHPDSRDVPGYYNIHESLPVNQHGIGHYRSLVDLMGHRHIGGNTVLCLIDGLYSGRWWQGRPHPWLMMPFYNDWPNSLFASQDAVAIDSVALDFWLEERPVTVNQGKWEDFEGASEDYLHEAAEANNPCSGVFYDPDHDGNVVRLDSLGVHEHWNNSTDKRYSRDLGIGDGIELIRVWSNVFYDMDGDEFVDLVDFAKFGQSWNREFGWEELRDFQRSWLNGVNYKPAVDAGATQIIYLPVNQATLDATVTDDGYPDPPGVVTTLWEKISGPGNVVFGDANAIDTTATFSESGVYELRLTAYDGGKHASDTVTVAVVPES